MAKKVDSWVFEKHRRVPKKILLGVEKHGFTDTPLYYVWCSIRQRCYNPKNPKYDIYGGKGVKMCESWKENFLEFLNWAINNGYEKGLSIDRIDGNGNYCPENCRWATSKEQNRNLAKNINITFGGKTMCLSAWAELLNINRHTLDQRLKKGWSVERALTTPVDVFYRRNYKK